VRWVRRIKKDEKARACTEEHEHEKMVEIGVSTPSRTAWIMHKLELEREQKNILFLFNLELVR
jgi:hypothetical protein